MSVVEWVREDEMTTRRTILEQVAVRGAGWLI